MTESQMHEIEVERAFLPNVLPPEIKNCVPTEVTDIYLSDETDLLTKMRLRQNGNSYSFTKKVVIDPEELSVQEEYNVPLSPNEFAMFRALGGRMLVKDRYVVDIEGRGAEVDVFKGTLNGFVLIEFEFSSTAERDDFTPPSYCIADVTQEDFVAGAYLAGKGYEDITSDLARFGYTPLYAN